MKDGLRFVDSDMHVMEPADLFEKYLDPAFKSRMTWTVGADGRPTRGMEVFDGLPRGRDAELQQFRKPRAPKAGTQQAFSISGEAVGVLSGSRLEAGRLDFAIERDYDAEAQGMEMEMEGVDIAVLYPTMGLGTIARDNMDPRFSLALCQAYNNWIHDFCQYSPDQLKFAAMLPLHDVNLACSELVRCVRDLDAVGSFIRPQPGQRPLLALQLLGPPLLPA